MKHTSAPKDRSLNHDELLRQCEDLCKLYRIKTLHLKTFVTVRKTYKPPTFMRAPVPGLKGWPDLLLFLGWGAVIFVEIKTGKGRLEPEQRAFSEWADSAGYCFYEVRDLETFTEIIKTMEV